jgi:hypothetical protein
MIRVVLELFPGTPTLPTQSIKSEQLSVFVTSNWPRNINVYKGFIIVNLEKVISYDVGPEAISIRVTSTTVDIAAGDDNGRSRGLTPVNRLT